MSSLGRIRNREEPLNLIKKLLDCNANLEAKDKMRRTPLMIIKERREDQRVSARDDVQRLLEQRQAASASSNTMRTLLSTNLGFFRTLEDECLTEHSHSDDGDTNKHASLIIKTVNKI